MKTKTHYPSYVLTLDDALYYGDADLLRDLLDGGLSPDTRTKNGEHLLIEVLKQGYVTLANLLQQRGASLEVRSLAGDSAYLTALPTTETWYLEAWWPNADVNEARRDGARPLHIAIEALKPRTISWLRRRGADLSLPNAQGETPLAFCRRLSDATDDRKRLAWLRDCEHALTAPTCRWDEEQLRKLLPALREEGLTGDSADELFRRALRQGNISAVTRLLAAGADPNAPLDFNHTRPLPTVYDGEASPDIKHALLRLLVARGAEPSEADDDGYSVLLQAASSGDAATVELMLELGGNPYRADDCYDETALSTAIESNTNPELIHRLLELGIDVNLGCDYLGGYPLRYAIFNSDGGLVQELLNRGAHPFHIAQESQRNMVYEAEREIRYCATHQPEKLAAAEHVLALLRARFPLIEAASPENTRSPLETGLWQAAAFGLAEDVDMSLWLHASPDACNLAGVSALTVACEKGHEQVVYTLLRYGANPNVSPSPLEAALRGKEKRTERIVRLLLGFGANPNGSGDALPLMLARTPQLIRQLLAAGAQVNAATSAPSFVSTALHRHARRGKTACAQALLDAGADTEVRNIHGMTPLHLAVARGRMECVRALLAAGADINARDHHGNTPLMTAFSHRRPPSSASSCERAQTPPSATKAAAASPTISDGGRKGPDLPKSED